MSEPRNRQEAPADGPGGIFRLRDAFASLSDCDRLAFLDLIKLDGLVPRRSRGPRTANRDNRLERLASLGWTARDIGNLSGVGMSRWAVIKAVSRIRRRQRQGADNSPVSSGAVTRNGTVPEKEDTTR